MGIGIRVSAARISEGGPAVRAEAGLPVAGEAVGLADSAAAAEVSAAAVRAAVGE